MLMMMMLITSRAQSSGIALNIPGLKINYIDQKKRHSFSLMPGIPYILYYIAYPPSLLFYL